MFYRGHWPSPLLSVSLIRRHTVRLRMSDNLLTGEGGGGGAGAKSYDHKKVWSSINHPLLSGGLVYSSL
jgi:hypothetical protein